MAQDERDSAHQDPNSGENFEDQVLEEKSLPVQPDQSRNESNGDARPVDNSSNNDSHPFSPSSGALRTPENLNLKDGGNGQLFGFKPRTIPGMRGRTRVWAALLETVADKMCHTQRGFDRSNMMKMRQKPVLHLDSYLHSPMTLLSRSITIRRIHRLDRIITTPNAEIFCTPGKTPNRPANRAGKRFPGRLHILANKALKNSL